MKKPLRDAGVNLHVINKAVIVRLPTASVALVHTGILWHYFCTFLLSVACTETFEMAPIQIPVIM
jgi:hypothetical protein